jgi:hypothetical protein
MYNESVAQMLGIEENGNSQILSTASADTQISAKTNALSAYVDEQ